MSLLDTFLDLVFPTRCLACGNAGNQLCQDCLLLFPAAERECANWIFPLYDYRHPPLKNALWLFKYKNKKRLAKIFAEALYGKILEELSVLSVMENFREPVLIPIPLSPKRYRERGYNQAELICLELMKISDGQNTHERSLGRSDGDGQRKFSGEFWSAESGGFSPGMNLKLENNVLIKPKDTEHQARIENRSQRLRNIVGSFAVKTPELIKGKNIILIDDIITTGATLSEARKTLRAAGARKVIAFTVAH